MEKFALLNLLNLLQGLAPKATPQADGGDNSSSPTEQTTQTGFNAQASAKPQEQTQVYPNVMASVIERHEAISNRIKNKK